jgi:hypothetical protein
MASGASYPKPEPEKAFAEMRIYDAAGRPWRAAVEDWPGARQRVAVDPQWAAWLKKERAEVDAWMARHRDRVEWVAGWSHDGVSPKDASRLRWNDRIPGEEVQFFSTPTDPRIEITPKLLAWWVVTFRGRHNEMMLRAARLFRLTGEERYAAWAAGQMDFYADNYLKWEPARNGARLYWQTLTEATNLIKYTETVRHLGDHVAAERRARWKEKFFLPEVSVLNASMQTIHNIATWQRCAAAQVALLFGDEAMWREALDGKFGLRRQMAEGITSDYLWHEQSLGYNNYVVQAVRSLFETAGVYGRAGELAAEMAVAENLMLSTTYLRFPNGMLPNPADSGAPGSAPNREALAASYRVFPTPLGLETVAGRRDWDTLLDPPPASPRASTLPPVTARSLESTRMALLKSGPWQVFLHYGQVTRSHTQAEVLNYSASFRDIDVTHDTGTAGYGSPFHRSYFTRGLNHNVPLVNGEGEETPPQAGELLAFAADRVSAAQPKYRKDARARRTLAIEGDTLIDTATIESTAQAPQRLGLAVHVQGKVRVPAGFAADAAFAEGRPEAFRYWRGVRGAAGRDRVTFDVDYAGTVLRLTIAGPGEFRVWHADTPDSPPHRRESLYLETPGTAATFTTTWAPAP